MRSCDNDTQKYLSSLVANTKLRFVVYAGVFVLGSETLGRLSKIRPRYAVQEIHALQSFSHLLQGGFHLVPWSLPYHYTRIVCRFVQGLAKISLILNNMLGR